MTACTLQPETSSAPPRARHHSKVGRAFGIIGLSLATIGLLAGCLSTDQTSAQNLINADRKANNRAAVVDFATSDTKAQAWAAQLAKNGSLSHTNLTDGYSGVRWCHLGENVGMGPSLTAIETAFMNSPPHKANIVSVNYDHVGTGVVKSGSTYFVVQEFVDIC